MFSTVSHWTVILLILIIFQVSANADLETLSQTVSEHTNILNEFPAHVENVKALEKQLVDIQPRLTVIEAHTRNLQSDVSELTNISIAYTEKLDTFVTYQEKTDKIENGMTQLFEKVEKQRENVITLELYMNRTNFLEDHIVSINDALKNNRIAVSTISKDVQDFQSVCVAAKDTATAEGKKINALQVQQQEISTRINEFVHDLEAKKNETSKNYRILQENCVAEQNELKTKVQKLNVVVEQQDVTKNKLNDLVTEIGKQNSTVRESLESLRNSVTAEQNQAKTELQKIEPLTKTHGETTKKLNDLSISLDKLKSEQQTLLTSLKQLRDQFEEFLVGHTPPPTTEATTPDPASLPIVIRKHIHARGNNIVVTI